MSECSGLESVDALKVKNAFHQYGPFEGHCANVTLLALRLFDQLQDLHKLDAGSRRLLLTAGLLHDIGYHVGGVAGHHKAARRLIVGHALPGYSDTEHQMVAQIARYHRKAMPKSSHEGFSALTGEQQAVVETLAAILRVADGLDRGQWGNVREVRVAEVGEDRMVLEIESLADPELEIWAALKKSGLFERVFGRKIEIRRNGGNRQSAMGNGNG